MLKRKSKMGFVLPGILETVRRIRLLISRPVFIILSIIGNFIVISGALAFYFIEIGKNPSVKSLLDSIWWAIATVTTVGYGDIHPITVPGKIVGICMMIVGPALFWSYTALFAEALISKEILDIESELKSIEKRLIKLSDEYLPAVNTAVNVDEIKISNLQTQINLLRKELSDSKKIH